MAATVTVGVCTEGWMLPNSLGGNVLQRSPTPPYPCLWGRTAVDAVMDEVKGFGIFSKRDTFSLRIRGDRILTQPSAGYFAMTVSTADTPNNALPSPEDYLVLGLATCFLKVEGEIQEVQIIEPIPSAALETLLKGVETSYRFAYATTFGALTNGNGLQKPAEFPENAQFCEGFLDRASAAARTYQRHPQPQNLLSVGTVYPELNYSTERKRVLNSTRVVRTEDNVKQHSHTHKIL